MDRLSPTGKFHLWKLRVLPMLESKAQKMGLKDAVELIPTVLDDTLCTAYAQWLSSRKDPALKDVLDFLESWMVSNKECSTDSFASRKWLPGETIEEYVAELESLAAPLHIKSSDRVFKIQFVQGLPPEVQPFLRLELNGASWPSISQLVDKAKSLKLIPSPNASSACALHPNKPNGPMSSRGSSIRCFNCGGYGHLANICPSHRSKRQGNGSRW